MNYSLKKYKQIFKINLYADYITLQAFDPDLTYLVTKLNECYIVCKSAITSAPDYEHGSSRL